MRAFKSLFLALTAAVAFGCQSTGVLETLDKDTFASVIVAEPPVTFYRLPDQPEYERELVSIGIVETIASRQRDLYLWVNAWRVLDGGADRPLPLTATISLRLPSVDFTLEKVAATHRELGISAAPYRSMRTGPGLAYYLITAEQISALADSPSATLAFADHEYELWGRQRRGFEALRQYREQSAR